MWRDVLIPELDDHSAPVLALKRQPGIKPKVYRVSTVARSGRVLTVADVDTGAPTAPVTPAPAEANAAGTAIGETRHRLFPDGSPVSSYTVGYTILKAMRRAVRAKGVQTATAQQLGLLNTSVGTVLNKHSDTYRSHPHEPIVKPDTTLMDVVGQLDAMLATSAALHEQAFLVHSAEHYWRVLCAVRDSKQLQDSFFNMMRDLPGQTVDDPLLFRSVMQSVLTPYIKLKYMRFIAHLGISGDHGPSIHVRRTLQMSEGHVVLKTDKSLSGKLTETASQGRRQLVGARNKAAQGTPVVATAPAPAPAPAPKPKPTKKRTRKVVMRKEKVPASKRGRGRGSDSDSEYTDTSDDEDM